MIQQGSLTLLQTFDRARTVVFHHEAAPFPATRPSLAKAKWPVLLAGIPLIEIIHPLELDCPVLPSKQRLRNALQHHWEAIQHQVIRNPPPHLWRLVVLIEIPDV